MRGRNIALLTAMSVVATVSVGALNRIQPRNALPDVRVSRGGRPALPLKSHLSERPALLLWRKGNVSTEDCEALSKLSAQIAKANLTLVLFVPDVRSGCVPDSSYIVDTPRTSAVAFGLHEVGSEKWRAVIVDTSGIVRLMRDFQAEHVSKAYEFASAWEAGRLSFITNCGHCHGDDGSDTSYPNVKTMAGISTRMKPDQILEGGQTFGAVDTASWTPSLKEAVLLYIEAR